MSDSKYTAYTRRAVLSRLGGGAAVAALTPFLPYTEAEAAASTKPRYVSMFTPVAPSSSFMNNVLQGTGSDVSDLQFKGEYTALNSMKDKMSLYRGMYNRAGDDSDLGGGHRGRCFTFLTGVPVKQGQVGAGSQIEGNNGNNESSSIDQYMVDQLTQKGVNTPLKELRFGWAISQVDSMDTASFKNGRKVFFDNSSKKIYDRLFAVAGDAAGGGEDLTYRANILSTVYKDLNRIKPKLSALDAKRLDQHLEAVNELEQEISNKPPVLESCDIPGGLSSASGYEDQSTEFAKLVAIAFNCDLTRVVSSMFGHPFDGIDAYNLNTHENRISNWHQATHGLGGSANDISNFIKSGLKYRADVYLKMLQELDAFDDPTGGTILDNSIVHWFSECISDHKYQDCFNVIGGGAGYFQMGKQHVVGSSTNKNNNAPLNMLLTSLGQAMGLGTANYGNYNIGPIPSKYLA